MIQRDRWRPAGGVQLEPNALTGATEAKDNLVFTAGPGAGKTEMLSQRADFLLRTGTCRYPQRVLAISFKVDASRNLKERVRDRCGNELARRLDSYTFHGFAKRLVDQFRPILTGPNSLDPDYTIGTQRIARRQVTFEDLIPLAVQILDTSRVALAAVRQTYAYIFLDEFQDCTRTQYQLVRAAFLGTCIPVTAVGDSKQRIMVWAGALDGILGTFAKDFSARSLNLYQNFRSEPRLRRVQNAMVKLMDPPAAVADSDLVGDEGTAEVGYFDDSRAEARGIADWIDHRMTACGVLVSEICILIPKQPELYSLDLIAELTTRGIPVRQENALQELSVEPVARLIVDFLSVAIGEREPEAYTRLMDFLVNDIDEHTSFEMYRDRRQFVEDERRKARKLEPRILGSEYFQAAAERLLSLLGREFIVGLSREYQIGDRLDLVIANTYSQIANLCSVHNDPKEVLDKFRDDASVRVMTIHKSKGLEFDSVVVLGVEEETFWSDPDEERSAFFVAVSRAKRGLYLSVAERREKPTGHTRRWDEMRTPHREFLEYVTSTE